MPALVNADAIPYPEIAAIRLGFGLSPLMPPPDSPAAVIASVADATRPDGWTTAAASAIRLEFGAARKARDTGKISEDAFRVVGQKLNKQRLDTLSGRIARALDAPSGFGERLVQFWADHFTAAARNGAELVLSAAFVDEAIRPHLNGRFGDMLTAADTHPMMLVYLDQSSSVGPNSPFVKRQPERRLGLNENLAREILELHTLGVGAAYTQDDVRQFAKLLTGLFYDPRRDRIFRPNAAEPGAKTVLGVSYGGRGTDGMAEIGRAMQDLAIHPDTAAHLALKLAVHFASDDPPADLVEDLAATWRGTGGDLAQVNAVLAAHPAIAQTFRQKARQPFDYLAASLRALGIAGDTVRGFDAQEINRVLWVPMQLMGQTFNRPRGPDGWPEAAADWITPQMLTARINWALRQPARLLDPLPDPRDLLTTALGSTASDALAAAVPRAESAREGIALVLASTDFNRR